MGTQLTDPHKIDLWETMLSHHVWGKTKPKWQKLYWAIGSALPELFQFQVNVGIVSLVWRSSLRPWENYHRFFSGFLPFLMSKPGWFLCGLVGFHCKRTAQFTFSFPAVLHSPDTRVPEALLTFIYPLFSYKSEYASWLFCELGWSVGTESRGLVAQWSAAT